MKKFISTLSVILVFTVFLCACVPESKNEITKLNFAEKYSDFELEAGEISEELCLFVTAKGKFDEATIIANSDNPAVANKRARERVFNNRKHNGKLSYTDRKLNVSDR